MKILNKESIEYQQEFYNDRWKSYAFANRLKLLRCAAILDALALTKLDEPRIIDLGCGAGWLAGIIGNFGPTIAVDLSSTTIAEASKKYPHVKFIQADVLDWNYPRKQFDIVISQEVIEHVEDQKKYLEIAYGLLREGGYLILTTPNARTLYAMTEEQRSSWTQQPIENWLTIGEFKNLLNGRFEVIRLVTMIHGYGAQGTYRFVNSERVRSLLKKIGFDGILDKMRMNFGYGLHILAICKKA